MEKIPQSISTYKPQKFYYETFEKERPCKREGRSEFHYVRKGEEVCTCGSPLQGSILLLD